MSSSPMNGTPHAGQPVQVGPLRRRASQDRSRWRQLKRWQQLLLVAAVLVHALLLVSWRTGWWNAYTFDSVVTRGWRGWDFFAIYQAGHNATTGVSVYESDNEKIDVVAPRYTPYRYLPLPALTLGRVLSLLPPLWALRLWVLVVECVLLTCTYACWRRARSPGQGAMAASMWLCFTPYYLELYMGQFTLIQAALVLVILLRPSVGRVRLDGLAWIASLLWKQNTGLLGPVLLKTKRWRLLFGAGAVVLVTSLPYFIATPGSLEAFLSNFAAGPTAHQLGNLGIRQWLYSLSTWLGPNGSERTHEIIQTGWLVAILSVCLWLTWRTDERHVTCLIALWMTAYFGIYHDVWEHHYVLLLPVLATLYLETGARFLIAVWALVALWTPYRLIDPSGLAAWHMPMRWTPLEPRWLDVLYHSCKAVPTLALITWIARRLLSPVPDAKSPPC